MVTSIQGAVGLAPAVRPSLDDATPSEGIAAAQARIARRDGQCVVARDM